MKDLTSLTNSDSSSSTSAATINNLFSKYFDFYSVFTGLSTNLAGESYTINDYLGWANTIGADLVTAEMKANGMDMILSVIEDIISYLMVQNYEAAYPLVISLLAYINSYSNIQSLIIFPTSLTNKTLLMERLDEFNVIDATGEDPYHAANVGEQVHYTDMVGTLTGSLNQLIDILSVVLIVLHQFRLLLAVL